ncbi:thiopeptide-type bacteriocin biosynthesis protein [Nonlabens xiamenensis]|uniref:thiopeptide-type bacteriocin biosynthesis protein n=1 Tax=Nonlabens xiamenensis TaxID=2341043 RepID=UPI000F61167D|nr:thiopeptide-type bacteriocin biosynthesis protein [Nonlabens xiamenensis]
MNMILQETSDMVQRQFFVGDEWIYYHIYCGPQTADDLLIRIIEPFCQQVIKDGTILQWFYLRYSDPYPHLRVRLKLKNILDTSLILQEFRSLFNQHLAEGLIWNLTLNSYQRELERYGQVSMELSEYIFWWDSLQAVEIIRNNSSEIDRFCDCFSWIEFLIKSFELDQEAEGNFIARQQASFRAEFGVDKVINKKLNIKYKNLESQLLTNKNEKEQIAHEITKAVQAIQALKAKNQLDVPITDLMASYIHMSINRMFRSEQRLYEMTIYDFLKKKYDSLIARYGTI